MTREMKNSGVQWIGDIPKDWGLTKVKYEISGYKAGPFGSSLITDKLEQEGKILVYTPEHVALLSDTCSNNLYLPESRRLEMSPFFVKEGDIVFPIVGSLGRAMKINSNKKEGIINQRLAKFRLSSTIIKDDYFLWLFARSSFYSPYIDLYSRGSIIVNLTKAIVGGMPIPAPPLSEQKAIADILDTKCGEIDGLLADLDTEVKTLAEYKKSLIAETVTRGLNPHAPMKQSGIPWADTIPAHWKVIANKYIMRKKKEIVPVYSGQDIISLSMNGVIVRDLDAGGKMPTSFNGYQQIYPGNLLMCLFDIDVTPRCIGLIKNKGLTSPAYSQFEMIGDTYAPYYYYFYLKMDNTKELVHLSKNMRHSLNEEQFGMIKTIQPPTEEQVAIADFLDTKCAAIDQAITDKTTQIETLKAYKASLIYEYVTGKKQVAL